MKRTSLIIPGIILIIILLFIWRKKKVPETLADFTFMYLIKNAFITFFAVIYYPAQNTVDLLSLAGHLFMIFESFLLLPFLSKKPHSLLILVLLDFIDFFLGTHFMMPTNLNLKLFFYYTISLNFLAYFLKNYLVKIVRK